MAKSSKVRDPWIQKTDRDHKDMGHQYSVPPDPRPSLDQKSGVRIVSGSTMTAGFRETS